jgi:hypothetical protein
LLLDLLEDSFDSFDEDSFFEEAASPDAAGLLSPLSLGGAEEFFPA